MIFRETWCWRCGRGCVYDTSAIDAALSPICFYGAGGWLSEMWPRYDFYKKYTVRMRRAEEALDGGFQGAHKRFKNR